jgi:hypothetical protein
MLIGKISILLSLGSLMAPALAFANDGAPIPHVACVDAKCDDAFWEKLEAILARCAVRPYMYDEGEKVYRPLRSTCAELRTDGQMAHFELDGKSYAASMLESVYSDDGDLWDVFVGYAPIQVPYEVVASRRNVPAFGDILWALAGGESNFIPTELLEE